MKGGGEDPSPSHAISYTMIDMSFSVARQTGTTVFDVLEQDATSVISVINYIIEKADEKETEGAVNAPTKNKTSKNGRVIYKRVDEKTATGGWY